MNSSGSDRPSEASITGIHMANTLASAGFIDSMPAVTQQINANMPDYLRVDSYFDSSDLSSALCFETTSDATNLVKVRGIILDKTRGYPSPYPIQYNKTVCSTLLAGVCPVTRTGTFVFYQHYIFINFQP